MDEFPIREPVLSGDRVQRRLAAILAADVVGYSRLSSVCALAQRHYY
jgi:class 3 adenylate cyclase